MSKVRLPSIDFMRGMIMVIMALDHVRDFFHSDALIYSPTDLTKTYPILFFTRIITHFCAPGFVLLAGISASIWGRDRPRRDLFFFLLTRGFWLILCDAIFISPVWTLEFGRFSLGALWAIGGSMITLSFLIFFEARVVLSIGLIIIFGHNLLDGVEASNLGPWGDFWHILHEQGALPFGLNGAVYYPILPWIGIMAFGYGVGVYFFNKNQDNHKGLTFLGLSFWLLFILLRFINIYGDPNPWHAQSREVMTILSFFNVSKYPPSLLYCLFTLGPMMLILAFCRNIKGSLAQKIIIFGRVPFLFYLLHLYLGITGAIALAYFQGYDFSNFQREAIKNHPPEGLSLVGCYIVWIIELGLLYPICTWFSDLKKRNRQAWLRYL